MAGDVISSKLVRWHSVVLLKLIDNYYLFRQHKFMNKQSLMFTELGTYFGT
jgi:hypothetical protein